MIFPRVLMAINPTQNQTLYWMILTDYTQDWSKGTFQHCLLTVSRFVSNWKIRKSWDSKSRYTLQWLVCDVSKELRFTFSDDIKCWQLLFVFKIMFLSLSQAKATVFLGMQQTNLPWLITQQRVVLLTQRPPGLLCLPPIDLPHHAVECNICSGDSIDPNQRPPSQGGDCVLVHINRISAAETNTYHDNGLSAADQDTLHCGVLKIFNLLQLTAYECMLLWRWWAHLKWRVISASLHRLW